MAKKIVLVLITGQSGSGLGTAIRALEDLGFYCIDNLPFELIINTMESLERAIDFSKNKFALGIHIHNMQQAKAFSGLLKELRKGKRSVEVLYLTAQKEVLLNRYSTTRRKHPYSAKVSDLKAAILKESKVLKSVEAEADFLIDTTELSPHDLGHQIENRYFPGKKQRKVAVSITSFGFKHGVCSPIDALYDVRFLKNPFFNIKLKEKNGLDKDVREYILAERDTKEFLKKLLDFNMWLLPRYHQEGKRYYRVGIACTGGKHRSVFVADYLYKHLKRDCSEIIDIEITHRDILY